MFLDGLTELTVNFLYVLYTKFLLFRCYYKTDRDIQEYKCLLTILVQLTYCLLLLMCLQVI